MADVYKGLTIKFGADTTGLSAALKTINADSRNITSELRKVDRALKFNPGNTDLLRQKQHLLAQQVDTTRQRLEALKEAQEQLGDEDVNSDQYRALQREIIETESRLSGLERSLEGVVRAQDTASVAALKHSEHLREQGKRLEDIGAKMGAVGSGMSNVGDTMTRNVTTPILAAAGATVAFATQYESSFAGVMKTTDMTAEGYEKLSRGIRDMSRELPASAADIARVAEAAGQLGIENENILSFSRTMIDLGESTNLTADQAATAMARFANITQMPQDQFSNLGSVIVALGNNMATTEAEIMDFGLRIAGAGKQVGLTDEQLMAIGATLSSLGIEAEAGGSAVSKTMIGIESAVQSGGKQLELWAKTANMSAQEFTSAWETDPAQALNSVIKGLGDMEAQGGSTLGMLEDLGITEIRQRDALLRAAGAGDLLTDALKISGEAWTDNSALADEAAKRYATSESQIKATKNQLMDTAITVGEKLLPTVLDLAESAAKVADSFSALSEEDQKLILKLLATAAAAGPVLKVGGGLVSTVGGLTRGLGAANIKLADYTAKLAASGQTGTLAFKSASALSGVLGAAWPIALGAAVIGVAALSAKLAYMQSDLYKARQAVEETMSTYVTFAEAQEGLVGRIGEVWTTTGQSITSVDGQIAEAQANITRTLNEAVMESGALRSQDVENVRNYYAEIDKLTLDKAQGLIESMKATSSVVLAVQDDLSAEEKDQYVADVKAKFDEAIKAYEEGYNAQLDLINLKHKEAGTMNSEAYAEEIRLVREQHRGRIAEATKAFEEQNALINGSFTASKDATMKGWQQAAVAARDGASIYTDDVVAAIRGGNSAVAAEAGRLSQAAVTAYTTGLSNIDDATTEAVMQAAIAMAAGTGTVDAATQGVVDTILTTLEQVPAGAEEDANTAARKMAESLVGAIPELKNAGEMTAGQIATAIRNHLQVKEGGLATIGAQSQQQLLTGLTTDGILSATVAGKIVASKINAGIDGELSNASTWGKHATENLAAGLLNPSAIRTLDANARSVSQRIAQYLKHTVPEKGPLADEREWMPHMIENLSSTLTSASPKLIKSAEGVAASLADAMNGARMNAFAAANSTTNSTQHNVYNIRVDATKMSSPDFTGLLKSIETAARMGKGV